MLCSTTVLQILFKKILPDFAKIRPLRPGRKYWIFIHFCHNNIAKSKPYQGQNLLIKFQFFNVFIWKKKATKLLKSSAPFRPFTRKSLMAKIKQNRWFFRLLTFFTPLFSSYSAKLLVSWQQSWQKNKEKNSWKRTVFWFCFIGNLYAFAF